MTPRWLAYWALWRPMLAVALLLAERLPAKIGPVIVIDYLWSIEDWPL